MERYKGHEEEARKSTAAALLAASFAVTPWERTVHEAAQSPETIRAILCVLSGRYRRSLETCNERLTHAMVLTCKTLEAGDYDDYVAAMNRELHVRSKDVRKNPNFNIVRNELRRYLHSILSGRQPEEQTPEELIAALSGKPLEHFVTGYVPPEELEELDEAPEDLSWPTEHFPPLLPPSPPDSPVIDSGEDDATLPDLAEAMRLRHEQASYWRSQVSSNLGKTTLAVSDSPETEMEQQINQLLSVEKNYREEEAESSTARLLSEMEDEERYELARNLRTAHQFVPPDVILRNLLVLTTATEAEGIAVRQHLTDDARLSNARILNRGLGHCGELFLRYEKHIYSLLQSQETPAVEPKKDQRLWQLKFLRAMLIGKQRMPFSKVLSKIPTESRLKAAETIRQAFLDMLVFTVENPPASLALRSVTVKGYANLERTHWRELIGNASN